MWRLLVLLLALSWLQAIEVKADEPPSSSPSPAVEQYEALLKQFKEVGRSPDLINGFMTLAREHADDPAALKALAWIIVNVREGDQPEAAVQMVLEQHLADENTKDICPQLIKTPTIAGEKLLRGLIDKSSHQSVIANGCFYLAEHLREQLRLHQAISSQPATRRRFEQFYGKQFTAQLVARDAGQMTQEMEGLYDRLATDFADVDKELTEKSQTQLNEIRHLAIGKPAMEIEGEEIYGEKLKLSDFRGKVVVLTFWGHW